MFEIVFEVGPVSSPLLSSSVELDFKPWEFAQRELNCGFHALSIVSKFTQFIQTTSNC